MWWTFKKKDAAKMADFHTNEEKTQPSEVDFLKDEREKDATRIGRLSERKTQPRWRTFKTKERHNQRWRTFNERDEGKTQPKWRTLTPEKKDSTKVGGLSEGKTQPKWRTFK